jgi:hypothetical protein
MEDKRKGRYSRLEEVVVPFSLGLLACDKIVDV